MEEKFYLLSKIVDFDKNNPFQFIIEILYICGLFKCMCVVRSRRANKLITRNQILCLKNQDEADFVELRSRSFRHHMGLEEEFNRHLRIGNREETNSEFITAHANNGLIRE